MFFTPDNYGLAGKYLDQQFRDDLQRPVDQFLRWHFRQAVLANMRGAGEPRFEHDFPPGSDIVSDILSGPKAGERMEFEVLSINFPVLLHHIQLVSLLLLLRR